MTAPAPAAGTVPARLPSAPRQALPAGACDCHGHVFGPLATFPTGASTYAIPLANPDVYATALARCGFERGVLVQPAPYGTDTRALENALKRLGPTVRAIAVADATLSDERMDALHAAGVRGLRFIEMRDPHSGQPYAGSVPVSVLGSLAPRMKARGWHAQVWAPCKEIPRVYDSLQAFDMPVVFDHMGQFDVEAGVDAPAFRTFLDVMREPLAWTKLSVCRVSRTAPDYDDVLPFQDQLVESAPERLLWGSDWPFVRMGDASPDVGNLLDVFQHRVDEATATRIFVDNPARLFGFSPAD